MPVLAAGLFEHVLREGDSGRGKQNVERKQNGAGLQRAAPRVFRMGNLPWGTLGPDSLCGRLATLACCCADCVAEGLLLEECINRRLLPNLSVEQAFGQAEF